MAKDIIYGEDARKALQTGIDKLPIPLRLPLVLRAAMWYWIRSMAHR